MNKNGTLKNLAFDYDQINDTTQILHTMDRI